MHNHVFVKDDVNSPHTAIEEGNKRVEYENLNAFRNILFRYHDIFRYGLISAR